MIYVNKNGVTEEEFTDLLRSTRKNSLQKIKNTQNFATSLSPNRFELFTYEEMLLAANGTKFKRHIERTKSKAFPDIIAKKYFGVEVKMTQDDKWNSLGNSVLESTRVEGVNRIYIYFGKFGGNANIKFRPYQECLRDIGVTHYPRYKIDMNLAKAETIFEKMGIDYETLRREKNPVNKIKKYYLKNLKEGEELWWIDKDVISPIITPLNKLDKKIKEEFVIKTMILFPEIFGQSSLKFERVATYLFTNFNSVCSNLRDHFTGGGQREIQIKGKVVKIRKIDFLLYENAKKIKVILPTIEKNQLSHYWRVDHLKKQRLKQWKRLILKASKIINYGKYNIVDIFETGLS